MLRNFLKSLPENANILDFGCFGWSVHEIAREEGLRLSHYGCDMAKPKYIPNDAQFNVVPLGGQETPYGDDTFDAIILSHVIEHMAEPLLFFQEMARICTPGGKMYIEAPSDRSAMVKSDADVDSHSFYSFWDDPTHVRPYSPAAFYRLCISYGFAVEETGYLGGALDRVLYPFHWIISKVSGRDLTPALWRAKKWACYVVAVKPADMKGAPDYVYLSLKDVKRGRENALAFRNSV